MSSCEKPVLEAGMKGLKDNVLDSEIEFLCEELGDPGRYFPQLKSKGILDVTDCDLIRSKMTCKEKILKLVELMKGRQSNKGEHSFDILVDALKKQRVQAHIARGLQKALAKAKEDLSGNRKPKYAEKVAVKPSLHHAQLVSEDVVDQKKSCDLHPEHGPLPPPPPPASSAQCMAATSYTCYDDQELSHSLYGQMPICTKTIDEVVFSTQQSWRNSSGLEFSSDSELGGQSLMTSLPTNVFSGSSLSTPTTPVLDLHTNTEDQTRTITALEERIKCLTAQLEAAHTAIAQRNNVILKLQVKLDEREESTFEEEKKLSKQSSSGEVDRPRALKLGPDQQLHRSRAHGNNYVATPGSSSSRLVCQERRGQRSVGGGESVAYNNYINYRNGAPVPSMSTV